MPTLRVRAHIDAALDDEQIAELSILLFEKRRELSERGEELEQQMMIKDDCSLADAADAASAQEDRLRAGGVLEQHRHVINEITAALDKLETGRYGVSEKTGEPIAYGRLKLIPWARTGTNEQETNQ